MRFRQETEMPTAPSDAMLLSAVRPVLANRFGGDGRFDLCGTRSGNFNRIYCLQYRGRRLGVRAMVGASHFRYEKTIIKEVFAAALLSAADGAGSHPVPAASDDGRFARTVEGLLARPRGEGADRSGLRKIHHYDWSLTDLPVPYFIFDWTEGVCLWETPDQSAYRAAGRCLAGLHRFRFQGFYPDIFAIGRRQRPWPRHLDDAYRAVLAQVAGDLPTDVAARLERVDLSRVPPGRPCLVHNDFSGANLLVDSDGGVQVIDWDNWVVDCPELDLVKMKYWTVVGSDRRLTHDARLFETFLDAYQAETDEPLDRERLVAYERLWLLRCFAFETARERQDGPRASRQSESWQDVYPKARFYRDSLRDL